MEITRNIIVFFKHEWFRLSILLAMVIFIFEIAETNLEVRLLNKGLFGIRYVEGNLPANYRYSGALNNLTVDAHVDGNIDASVSGDINTR